MPTTYTLAGGIQYRPRFPDSPFITVCDIVNQKSGKTSREENEEKQHNIQVGTLVEIVSSPGDCDRDEGVRLYVVHHHRDCDGTPLYAMSADRYDTEQENQRFHNSTWVHGYPEYALKIVRKPKSPN